MRLFLLLAFLCIPFDAEANCEFQQIPDTEIRVLDSVAARHVQDGSLTGCLLKLTTGDPSKKPMQAYTPYDFICELPKDEQLKVSFGQSCCDTGDDGDFTCGVKPINPLVLSYGQPVHCPECTRPARHSQPSDDARESDMGIRPAC